MVAFVLSLLVWMRNGAYSSSARLESEFLYGTQISCFLFLSFGDEVEDVLLWMLSSSYPIFYWEGFGGVYFFFFWSDDDVLNASFPSKLQGVLLNSISEDAMEACSDLSYSYCLKEDCTDI